MRLVLRAHMAEVRNAVTGQLGRHKRIQLVAGSRLSHGRRLPPFRTFVSNSAVQRICRICGRNAFDVVGRRFVRRGVQREYPLESGPDGRGLLVGFSSGSFDSYRRCRRRCPIRSKTVVRIVRVARFVCRRRAGLGVYDPESSLIRASQSFLRIICSDVALFLSRAWLGNGDQQVDAFSICHRCAHGRLGAEQLGDVHHYSFCTAAGYAVKILEQCWNE